MHRTGMRSGAPVAGDPDAYVAALTGWQRGTVETLRAVKAAAPLDERIKWTHLVYSAHGPVLLIRAEPERVLFGFWRGKRLRSLEPRLNAGGKYEMATIALREDESVPTETVEALTREAGRLNAELGDPTGL